MFVILLSVDHYLTIFYPSVVVSDPATHIFLSLGSLGSPLPIVLDVVSAMSIPQAVPSNDEQWSVR